MNGRRSSLAVLLALLLLGSLSAFGQSGRKSRSAKPSSTPPVVATPETTRVESKEVAEPTPIPAAARILVAGEVKHHYAYYSSSELDTALKECVRAFRSPPRITDAVKLGKVSLDEAKEQAKKETDAYILWISFVTTDDALGNMRIAYADYIVLMPKTADRLTSGRVKPATRSVIGTGGIIGLPAPPRTRSSPVAARQEMKDVVRQIPAILRHGGWLDR